MELYWKFSLLPHFENHCFKVSKYFVCVYTYKYFNVRLRKQLQARNLGTVPLQSLPLDTQEYVPSEKAWVFLMLCQNAWIVSFC